MIRFSTWEALAMLDALYVLKTIRRVIAAYRAGNWTGEGGVFALIQELFERLNGVEGAPAVAATEPLPTDDDFRALAEEWAVARTLPMSAATAEGSWWWQILYPVVVATVDALLKAVSEWWAHRNDPQPEPPPA